MAIVGKIAKGIPNCDALTLAMFVVVAAAAAGCGTEEPSKPLLPGECATPLAIAAPADTGLTVAAGGALVDAAGRSTVMRGINAGGRSKWAPFVPFPIDADEQLASFKSKASAYFARLIPWGLDTVRLTFSWEALEPTKGTYDETYLDRYEAMVDAAHSHGVRVIIDFHQDVYSSPYCGDGFPLWTMSKPDRAPPCRDNKNWFVAYLQTPVQDAFKRFFANKDGVLDAFKAMWTKVATRFAKHPAVVGFEIINEPGGWRSDNLKTWKDGTLTPFHNEMIALLREPDVGGNKLVLFDNPGVEALAANTYHVRPQGDGLIYAPHYYDSGLLLGGKAGGQVPAEDLKSHAKFSNEQGVHVLLGEFGYGHGAQGGEGWLKQLMVFVDAQRWSATVWEYSHNEEMWNKEDLSVVDVDGKERPILDTYVRPWLRAVAGIGATFAYEANTGIASAEWTAKDGVSEVVVPSRVFASGPKEIQLNHGCWTWDAKRSELRVKAEPGDAVKLSFSR